MSGFLKKIRQKNEHEKKLIITISTVLVLAFFVLIWFKFTDFSKKEIKTDSLSQLITSISNQIKDPLSNINNGFEKVKTSSFISTSTLEFLAGNATSTATTTLQNIATSTVTDFATTTATTTGTACYLENGVCNY